MQGGDHSSPGWQGHYGMVGLHIDNVAICKSAAGLRDFKALHFTVSVFFREDLSQIPYTTMCIKESLRLYPPVPGMSRKTTKPMTFFDGRTLPEGQWCSSV